MTGLYVHVPFCARACPYCDFDFQVGRHPPVDAYLDGLVREIEGRELAKQTVETVYLGGGTPSILGASLGPLMETLREHFVIEPGAEITMEYNPEHASRESLEAARGVGVNRISLGVQSFSDKTLSILGRVHRGQAALEAVAQSRQVGLATSVDLIIGTPGQTREELALDLQAVADSGVDHLSIYALSVEAGTPWEALIRRGQRRPTDEDAQADALLQAEAALTAAGFEHYEVASYARGGARARHNLLYWTFRDYLGLGPSAHSARFREGRVSRRGNRRGFLAWSKDPATPALNEHLSAEASAAEGLFVGLRVLPGLDLAAYRATFSGVQRRFLEERVAPLLARGDLVWADGGARLKVAPTRWLFHDAICADLL